MRKTRTTQYIIGLLLSVALITACSVRRGEPIAGPLDTGTPELSRGKMVFMRYCEKCHPGGEAGVGYALNNKSLWGIHIRFQVRHGWGPMPAFKKNVISKDEMHDLVAYIHALHKHRKKDK